MATFYARTFGVPLSTAEMAKPFNLDPHLAMMRNQHPEAVYAWLIRSISPPVFSALIAGWREQLLAKISESTSTGPIMEDATLLLMRKLTGGPFLMLLWSEAPRETAALWHKGLDRWLKFAEQRQAAQAPLNENTREGWLFTPLIRGVIFREASAHLRDDYWKKLLQLCHDLFGLDMEQMLQNSDLRLGHFISEIGLAVGYLSGNAGIMKISHDLTAVYRKPCGLEECTEPALQRCSGCNVQHYCGRSHQMADRRRHKPECWKWGWRELQPAAN